MSRLALVLALLPVAAAVSGALVGKGGSSAAALHEEAKAFETGAASLNAEGFKAFLEVASHSAFSEKSRQRHAGLVDRVADERSADISMSDHFANNIAEAQDTPTLRELAKSHWDGIKDSPEAKKPQAAQAKSPAGQSAAQPGSSLRNILMNAGRPGL
mmetsp:Transcript_67855/g.201962  ORF Transcript_67855/g.201962 Transcript_67855/m.201962 type:complete len:158 (-) Transcript_67855:34-507(-)